MSASVDALKAVGRALPGPVKSVLRAAWHRRGAFVATRGLRRLDPALAAEWAPYARPVSIVIPSYNDIPLLTACLRSIERTCRGVDYEVIVVDDYCDEKNSERLRALEGGRVRVLFKEQRGGFAVTVNQGMREAKHDIILLNSDIVALPGWVEALQLAAHGGDPAIGLVSGRLLYPDGRIQYGGTYWARTRAPQWFSHRYGGHLATHQPSKVASYNWGASGACLYIPRSTYEKLGGLDEEYWLGFEDVDYAMRAWEAGFRSYYAPRATLFHHESATRGYHQGNRELGSMRLFWSKWPHLHTSKTQGTPTREVDLVVAADDDALWVQHVTVLATRLKTHGWTVRLHTAVAGDEENLVAKLAPQWSLKIAASTSVLTTVWLGSALRGIPVHLMRRLDPSPDSTTVAALAPEFDYIVPDAETGARLQALTSWPATAVVAPAMPRKVTARAGGGVLAITRDARNDSRALDRIRAAAPSVEVVETDDDSTALERVEASGAEIVIDLRPITSSLYPVAVLASGAALIGQTSDATAFELLDGVNCFLIPPGDLDLLAERLGGLLGESAILASVVQNGRVSAAALAEASTAELSGALVLLARRRA